MSVLGYGPVRYTPCGNFCFFIIKILERGFQFQGSTKELCVMMRRDGGMTLERDSGWTGLEVLARGRGL